MCLPEKNKKVKLLGAGVCVLTLLLAVEGKEKKKLILGRWLWHDRGSISVRQGRDPALRWI
jgi:hypothetical protein